MKIIKKKRGFTVVELVATLALLGISTSLVVVVISNLANIQNASSDQYVIQDELNKIDNFTNDYISFVSLNNSDTSFAYYSSDNKSLTFRYNNLYEYIFSYANSKLLITNNYDGSVDYFYKAGELSLKYTSNISFNYNDELNLFKLSVSINGIENNLLYLMRSSL